MNSSGNSSGFWATIKHNIGRFLLITMALGLLGAVSNYVYTSEYQYDVVENTAPRAAPWVSVETVNVTSEDVEISAFAEVRPRWSAELTAAVSGRIVRVSDNALVGEPVEKGTTLVEIEDTRYVADVAAAKLALQEAQLSLWRAQNAVEVARKEFARTDRTAPNDLALRLPQLNIAKISVASAEAMVKSAEQQLADATIVAPFSGFVTDRFVSVGQTVNLGDRLVKMVDNEQFELTVELSRKDWALLKQPLEGLEARIVDETGKTKATAKIRQAGGFLDETTRQHKVFLDVGSGEEASLLSGDFVRVKLPGITVPIALNIPASALSQEGKVWLVDTDNRLRPFTANVFFRFEDRIVIEGPDSLDTLDIAVTPLASFLPGQEVQTYAHGSW
ncbi:MAG: efflux RND transporter periplasmic adaptor subunit [Pseudomonadota bacterium]